jgi:hypothetical protein
VSRDVSQVPGLWTGSVGEIKQQALMVVLVGVDWERATVGKKEVKESRW